MGRTFFNHDVGVIKPPKVEIKNVNYKTKVIEHLVDQIIKLHEVGNTQNNYGGNYYNGEITKAMDTLNKALKNAVNPVLFLKPTDDKERY